MIGIGDNMKIVSHLPILMAKRKVKNINRLAAETGVSSTTLYRLYDGTNTRIDYDTLIKLCAFFNCTVGELLEYVPEKGEG
jgi:Predicted transcriptional regulator